jgi:hypothetical protein
MARDTIKALSPRDLATLYIGTFQMLQDLSAVTRRLPGGISGRIQLAHLALMSVKDDLDELVKENPDKLEAVCEYLELSQERAIYERAQEFREKLA